jgi:hypothetical protein
MYDKNKTVFINNVCVLKTRSKNEEDESRALENLGRVYARSGKFKEAIDVWEKKLPLVATEMEKAWLYHEVGRCYLELSIENINFFNLILSRLFYLLLMA